MLNFSGECPVALPHGVRRCLLPSCRAWLVVVVPSVAVRVLLLLLGLSSKLLTAAIRSFVVPVFRYAGGG